MDNTPLEEENTRETTIQRLREFSYYLTENIEKNLTFCLTLLEDRPNTKKPNSTSVTAISTVATPIPYIGKGISSALKEGEIYILNKIDNNNSRTVADLVYYFSDNKETMRQLLIESSADVFYCFEQQFTKLTCGGGPRRAMQKLAKDAANRIFTHFLKNKQTKNVSRDDFSKGVMFGDSVKNKFGVRTGKTVKNDETEWKTSSIYKKVGLFFDETNEFFGNEDTKSEKYGHRRIFAWENADEIREKWSPESSETPEYYLKKEELPQLVADIKEYVMSKTASEEAMLDREKKHEEVMDDQRKKHEEVVATFVEKFREVIEDLRRNYEEIKAGREQSEVIVTIIKEERTVQEERHQEIATKLSEIHTGVVETREGQVVLTQTTENIRNDVCEIKAKQEEFSSTAVEVREAIQQVSEQKNPSLSDLVRDNYEVKKMTRVVNEVKESISNAEPKVRREVKKGLKKLFR